MRRIFISNIQADDDDQALVAPSTVDASDDKPVDDKPDEKPSSVDDQPLPLTPPVVGPVKE